MDSIDPQFDARNAEQVARMAADPRLKELSHEWFLAGTRYEYSYHFTWLGLPIIQWPQDMVALQEIVWKVKPELIIETGVARGGSLIFYASLLELIGGSGHVLGIDIDIRAHNRAAIEGHKLFSRITLMEGSSVDAALLQRVRDFARGRKRVMVVLDSNHTHDHVLAELQLYSPLVDQGSYLVVLDTIVEDMPADFFPDRPWSPGNNPKTAVADFLRQTDRFVVDQELESKLLVSVAPSGYLKAVKPLTPDARP